eukprot:TRINITY_DN11248_c0_g1_i1.p1 TRINITY_DN11248_c0_g1~~TRINITY_DN11248_c0_g1_i1.p1  ORF type:complete len:430 (+),score=79.97 TRINITY_DN11248_c0_g1_i1:81-1292(+)
MDDVRIFRQGWKELDLRERAWVPKVFIALTVLEATLVSTGAIYMMIEQPEDRYGKFLWMMTVVGAIFLLYFGCDAVFKENAMLLVVFNLGCGLITVRLWFLFVSRFMTSGYAHEITESLILAAVTICQIGYLALSKTMFNDYGRHIYVTVGAKLHIVRLYKTFQYWLSSLKTDIQTTALTLIIAGFYFDLTLVAQLSLAVYLVALVLLYIATLRWVSLEDSSYLTIFAVFSFAQPVLSVVGIVHLNSNYEKLKTDVVRHESINTVESNNITANEETTAALILINTTIGLCVLARVVMLVMLARTVKGFGKGLAAAMYKTETCAVTRKDTDDWNLVDRATGFETYHDDDPCSSPCANSNSRISERYSLGTIPCEPNSQQTEQYSENTPLERVKNVAYSVPIALE